MTITNLNSKSYSETEILFAVENFVINIHLAGFNHAQKPEFKELLELFDTIYDIDYCYNDYISDMC